MKKNKVLIAISILLVVLFCATAIAGGHGKKEKKEAGILLVAFGSSMPEAQVSFENIDREVKASFSKIPVRWAYTSHMIRRKLAKSGKYLDSPEVALAKMLDEGFTHVAAQSLHTIGGYEFHDLRRTVHQFQYPGGFHSIMLGFPLLSSQKDMQRVRDAIIENIPKERKQNEGIVLMGHGTHHPSNAFYAALMFQIQRKDPNIFIGCVEGYPEIDEIIAMLKEKSIKKVYLMPFMSVAGDHARNDMAGDDEDSWKSILTKAGIESVPILKGTAEYGNMVDIWVDHLGTILDQL
ncbi:MAG TPA: sirohydrochlorin cobaltochelatase [Deltaproteobacteria bacterium]|nr:sirohydrochlorin cobaltochelatase [Deltaproteobacteria bacterium]